MEFAFQKDDSASSITDISFWAQGKSIFSVTMNSDFSIRKYESSYITYVFYGPIKNSDDDLILKVRSSKGDYITVGSVTMADKKVYKELKENRNEILVASTQDEVCFPISYSSKIMHITGKIYTFKAKGIFKDSEGKPIEVENKKLENDFTNGILSEINSIGFITKKMKLVLIVYKVPD